jgi:hypothetical protein
LIDLNEFDFLIDSVDLGQELLHGLLKLEVLLIEFFLCQHKGSEFLDLTFQVIGVLIELVIGRIHSSI